MRGLRGVILYTLLYQLDLRRENMDITDAGGRDNSYAMTITHLVPMHSN